MRCVFDLFYRVGGEDRTLSCNTENDDLSLLIRDEAGRRTVVLRAKRDLDLKAYRETEHDLPGAAGEGLSDLFFLNGYQSWTDSKESIRLKKENNIYK